MGKKGAQRHTCRMNRERERRGGGVKSVPCVCARRVRV